MQQRRKKKKDVPNLGYKRGLDDAYELGKEIGRGGNGVVRLARHKASGAHRAMPVHMAGAAADADGRGDGPTHHAPPILAAA